MLKRIKKILYKWFLEIDEYLRELLDLNGNCIWLRYIRVGIFGILSGIFVFITCVHLEFLFFLSLTGPDFIKNYHIWFEEIIWPLKLSGFLFVVIFMLTWIIEDKKCHDKTLKLNNEETNSVFTVIKYTIKYIKNLFK